MLNRIQINRTVVDEPLLKEIRMYLVPMWMKIGLSVIAIILVGIGCFAYMNQQLTVCVVALLLAALSIFAIFYIAYTRGREAVNMTNGEAVYTMIFQRDGIAVHNVNTGTNSKIPYENVKRLVETKNTYTIIAKGNQFVLIRKDVLKVTPAQLVEFLKDKDTKIKRWIKTK